MSVVATRRGIRSIPTSFSWVCISSLSSYYFLSFLDRDTSESGFSVVVKIEGLRTSHSVRYHERNLDARLTPISACCHPLLPPCRPLRKLLLFLQSPLHLGRPLSVHMDAPNTSLRHQTRWNFPQLPTLLNLASRLLQEIIRLLTDGQIYHLTGGVSWLK